MGNINIRMDDNIKKNAENVFKQIGLTPTAAITLFYYQVIRTNSIPFELKAEIPNQTTLAAIKEVEKMEKNPDKCETFDTVDTLMEDLIK